MEKITGMHAHNLWWMNMHRADSAHTFTCTSEVFSIFPPMLYTALTVQNVVQELRGVDLLEERLSGNVLGIPSAKFTELKSAHRSTDEQRAAIVRYWLLRDPLASWRQIIYRLDRWYFNNLADRIRHYAEELTGMCLS